MSKNKIIYDDIEDFLLYQQNHVKKRYIKNEIEKDSLGSIEIDIIFDNTDYLFYPAKISNIKTEYGYNNFICADTIGATDKKTGLKYWQIKDLEKITFFVNDNHDTKMISRMTAIYNNKKQVFYFKTDSVAVIDFNNEKLIEKNKKCSKKHL